MKCPFCTHPDSKVLDSRSAEEGTTIRRRRECLSCSKRFTTYEKLEALPLVVVKKNGQREVFSANKILTGLIKACEKRPVSVETLEAVVREIEREILNTMEREVSSQVIGEMVMERLQELDPVAYVRFASVYREFKDLDSFMHELENLLRKKSR
ncbi:MAG: transcriptional regulator NrdR [Bacillota bacterium]